jgi:Tol biopolymer transport system component
MKSLPLYLLALALPTWLAACGGDSGQTTTTCNVGESCPCSIPLDCPDPLVETCNVALGLCVPAVDAGSDTNGDTTQDPDLSDSELDVSTDVPDDVQTDVEDIEQTDISDTDVTPDEDVNGDVADLGDSGTDTDADTGVDPDGAGTPDVVDPGIDPPASLANPLIAFESNLTGAEQVWIAALDGTGLRHIAIGDLRNFAPTWSPDGTQLAMIGLSRESGRSITIVDLATAAVSRLETGDLASVSNPAWSRDGRWMAFDAEPDRDSAREVYVLDLETPGATPVLVDGDEGADFAPRWTYDGRLWFATERFGGISVAVVGRDFAAVEEVSSPSDMLAARFALSPIGDAVIASVRAGDSASLVRHTIADEETTVIGDAGDGAPDFSPAADFIVFDTDRFGGRDLVLADEITGVVTRRVLPAINSVRNSQVAVAPVESTTVTPSATFPTNPP